MTIIEILDGLAELGRLRLEREARERAEQAALAQVQDAGTPTPAQRDPDKAAHDNANA